jgi:hypothetical protein
VEVIKERRVIQKPLLYRSFHEEFLTQKVFFHKKVRSACEGAEGKVLHREALRHHAHLLERL